MRRLAGVLLAVALVLETAPAAAADPDAHERAHVAFERGREAYSARRYAAAAALFEESATHVLHPSPLVNAADAWERADDPVRAAQAYDRVLALPDLATDVRALVVTRLGKILPRVGTLELEGPSGATVRVDGGAATALPLRARVVPGRHEIEVAVPARAPARLGVVCDPGVVAHRVVSAGDEPPPPPPTPAPTPRRETTRSGPPLVTVIAYGAAVVGLGGGIGFGVTTLDARARWVDTGDLEARSDFYRDRALTNVGFGLAIVGAAIGTFVWLRSAR
jgi:hypothetical protein